MCVCLDNFVTHTVKKNRWMWTPHGFRAPGTPFGSGSSKLKRPRWDANCCGKQDGITACVS